MNGVKSVCVFCGASGHVGEVYRQVALDTGRLLAEAGLELVYGGGKVGLMGLVADGALKAGGRVVGIIPDYLQSLEIDHPGLTELVVVDDLMTRKRQMMERSHAFLVLPGGFGTLDELFEVLTWKQLGHNPKPVVLVNTQGYYTPLAQYADFIIGEKFARPSHRDLFTLVDTPEQSIAALRQPVGAIEHPRAKIGPPTAG
jgi:uncharacterized protein (TIGR00730 family)